MVAVCIIRIDNLYLDVPACPVMAVMYMCIIGFVTFTSTQVRAVLCPCSPVGQARYKCSL